MAATPGRTGDRPAIRAARETDADAIALIYAPYVRDTMITFETEPPDAAQIRERMCRQPRLPWFVATRGARILGYAYASMHRDRAAYRWSADVAIYLQPDEHGRGIGRALYQALIPAARALGYTSLYAGVTVPNPASVGLHEAMGFRLVGVYRSVGFKGGRWLDVAWYELAAPAYPSEPSEPRSWPGNGILEG